MSDELMVVGLAAGAVLLTVLNLAWSRQLKRLSDALDEYHKELRDETDQLASEWVMLWERGHER